MTAAARQQMLEFWKGQSQNAQQIIPEDLNEEEIPEILSLLPDLKGKTVLELGAGTGRFTGHLCRLASSVIAVDFIDNFVSENEKVNGSGKGADVTFKCCDVTALELPPKSVDVIFSNWLFMYLSDEEARDLLKKALSWLRDDGVFFFRESCFHESGNMQGRSSNPTLYRLPADYMTLVESVFASEAGEEAANVGYELVMSRSIQTYAKRRKNNNQICWLLSKVKYEESQNQGFKTFQQFLDSKQYSRNGILRYEKIFGRHFVSTGGRETTEEFVEMLNLKPGQAVLDIGAGIGGSAFYMAEKYDVTVLAIDLSSNMVNIGLERINEIGNNRVQFEIADATKRKYTPESFDVVYSRDTILHIKDKRSLFQSFYTWLKPGGKVLISDYSCSEGEHSEVFRVYVKQRGYHLLPVKQYGQVLEEVGFTNVRAEDRTEQFISVLERELAKTKSIKEDFVQEFSQQDYDAIVNGWTEKLQRVRQGDQKWGLFYGEKPC